ncbi:DUF3311 domain-containing protein [Streptomyces iconiensis]|uniref:DUF3311 domain-containing protein n=1 Tax=Streptomyces iconiensis TaxID=1384038 RepID=A0ABT7A9D6_9ACTN|nr:DUF3311 domain-containing protein [Streptomyces iconiensis]MDJ1137974.1 DUF3311 domain-containing protein [Streptomyces iconiensis]
MPDPHPPEGEDFPRIRAKRPALWLLLIPALLYCAAPVVANSIEPRVFGIPFLLAWIIGATIVSPIIIWVVSRLDPVFKEGAVEPLPVDDEAEGAR